MAKYGRGLICVTLTEQQVDRLELPMMTAPRGGGPPLGTAFTVSIEARDGVTTGISAADRAHTIQVAIDPERPARRHLSRRATCSRCARAAAGCWCAPGRPRARSIWRAWPGCNPAGVICEIMNDDGTMARMPDLEQFAARARAPDPDHRRPDRLPPADRAAGARVWTSSDIVLDRTGTPWHAIVYEATWSTGSSWRWSKASSTATQPVLCRMHSGSTLADTFASTAAGGRAQSPVCHRPHRAARAAAWWCICRPAATSSASSPRSRTWPTTPPSSRARRRPAELRARQRQRTRR